LPMPRAVGRQPQPGKYDLAVEGGKIGSSSIPEHHVKRGDRVKVRVTMKPPPSAVAPFDEKQARKHQEAWQYLGVPVETTTPSA